MREIDRKKETVTKPIERERERDRETERDREREREREQPVTINPTSPNKTVSEILMKQQIL